MPNNRHPFIALALIVVLFLAVGALYAINTPPWQAPDEPAHYNYVAQIAQHGCCPVIAPGDWDAAELEAVKAAQFPEDADLSGITYEDWQPPLYYLAALPVFAATGGSLIALRLTSLAFGAGVVIAAYFVAARVFPQRKALALATAAFVGFIPQHMAILASVNNDSLAEMLLGILMVIAVGYVGNPALPGHDGNPVAFDESQRPHAAAMGGFLGLIFLTKLTPVLPALLIVLLAIAWRWRIEGRPAGWLAQQVGWGVMFGAVFGATWWGRNALVYGFPDVLGLAAHNAVVVGQPRTADLIAANGLAVYWREYLSVTHHSFWGQFGWMGVPMQPHAYLLTGAFMLWALAGLAILFARFRAEQVIPARRAALWMLMSAGLASVVVYAYYNLTFVQFQGRYLYTGLIPLGLGVALGAWGWGLVLRRWLPAWLVEGLPLIAVAWMPPFALYVLYRVVMPNLV